MGGRSLRTQDQNAVDDLADIRIGRDQAFGMQLTEGDMQRPLIGSELPQTVQRQIDTLPDADSGGAREQQRPGRQIIAAAQFLLQPLIVWRGKRLGR
jgi:hypothetical protein